MTTGQTTDEQTGELRCSCGYLLQGLTEKRCPECGYDLRESKQAECPECGCQR